MNITVKTTLAFLKAASKQKPEGWLESILQRGQFDGNELTTRDNETIIEIYGQEWFDMVSKRHPTITNQAASAPAKTEIPLPPEAVANPSLVTMAKTLGFSIWRWAKCGFKLAPESVIESRRAICLTCHHWDATGNAGLGKCKICGCTGIKHKLPDEKCPDNPPRWEAVQGV